MRPLGQHPPAGVGEPVVDLVDGQLRLGYQGFLLVVVGVRILLMLLQPLHHLVHCLWWSVVVHGMLMLVAHGRLLVQE